jgi:serine-type D-Ala-D-Ala carboxypeptidase/endopeptidase
MGPRGVLGFLLGLIAGVCLHAAWVARERVERPVLAYDFGRVDEAIDGLVRRSALPGASMVVRRHGEVIYARDYGGFTPDDNVVIGSATKWMSTAVLMSLVDDGKLSLSDPVQQYVPALSGPAKSTITVRQLLSHTSGLPHEHPCQKNYRTTLAECAGQIASAALLSRPGEVFRYGGPSMQLAGRVAEVAGGAPWRTLFQERIAVPLGLEHTQYGRFGLSNNPGIAGNATTTSRDFAIFLQMFLGRGSFGGTRVLTEGAIAEMERGHTAGLPRKGHVPDRHRGARHDLYGLGLWRDVLGSDGGLLVSSSPGKFGFTPWIDRRMDLVGVFAVQMDGRTDQLRDQRPDPAGVQQLVCDVVLRAERAAGRTVLEGRRPCAMVNPPEGN